MTQSNRMLQGLLRVSMVETLKLSVTDLQRVTGFLSVTEFSVAIYAKLGYEHQTLCRICGATMEMVQHIVFDSPILDLRTIP